jgi:hypothetical protein
MDGLRWYVYKMEFYLVIKKNEIMLFGKEWMELGIIMCSEISQPHTFCVPHILHMWKPGENKTKQRKRTSHEGIHGNVMTKPFTLYNLIYANKNTMCTKHHSIIL